MNRLILWYSQVSNIADICPDNLKHGHDVQSFRGPEIIQYHVQCHSISFGSSADIMGSVFRGSEGGKGSVGTQMTTGTYS